MGIPILEFSLIHFHCPNEALVRISNEAVIYVNTVIKPFGKAQTIKTKCHETCAVKQISPNSYSFTFR